MTNYHLVVLVHGLWGNTSHFDYIAQELREGAYNDWNEVEEEQLVVYTATLNEGFRTYDGIDVCGFRVAQEIVDQVDFLEQSSSDKITKFSMVGYSLGGLISRYALGMLYKSQFFKRRDIELLNFTTFCTPHVGVLAPGRNFAVRVFNTTVPWLLGNSGKQMFLKDCVSNHGLDGTDEGLPLIYLMSLETSVFYKALQGFKYKCLYANIINDKRTAWWTSGISLNDPFFNIDEYNGVNVFQYVTGFEGIIVDRNNPIMISKIQDSQSENEKNSNPTSSNTTLVALSKSSTEEEIDEEINGRAGQDFYFFNYWFMKIGKWILVIVNLLIIAPLLVLWKVVQSSTEMTISTIRVTRFVNKYSHQLMHDFFDISAQQLLGEDNQISSSEPETSEDDERFFLHPSLSRTSSIRDDSSRQEYGNYLALEGSLNDQADNLMESIYDAIERKNTHAGLVEEAPPTSGKILSNSLAVTIRELENKSTAQLITKYGKELKELIDNLYLDLSPRQVAIIKSLNKIDWEKYPIYIRSTPSAHACAIVRQRDSSFHEGEIVVRHWVNKVFQKR